MSTTKGLAVDLCTELGRRIKEEREGRNPKWSQDRLAEEATAQGVELSGSAVDKYEHGGMPTAPRLLAIALALGVEPAWLLTGDPPKETSPGADNRDIHRFTARQLRRLADQLERAAEEGVDMLSVKPGYDEKTVEPPEGKDGEKDGEEGGQGLGKPRSGAG